ncbi:hypothetical protein EYZ11_010111 [Aspergillus tanneri]|uniref:Uncharacterized protein n=1 Tax=Aspergillus tanneri TaxID=1220188 RepID=A0A4V3UNA4_9EURO|nr:uncharacterized protein ATNIH1004_011557 [Aspergillus tanneri]KAA8642612.1 hypothetical protein ATNIH1004_011557 [Aspergillus tanneri]THC90434.1 hypothetical protein EYZ11_010111 [Aspergillus tanneri]
MDTLEELVIAYMPVPDRTQCGQWISKYDCANFGFPPDIQTFYVPAQFPQGSAETLRNIGALTTPVSDVVTFIIGGDLILVTAVSTDSSVPTGASESSGSGYNNSSSENTGNGSLGSGDEQAASDDTPKDFWHSPDVDQPRPLWFSSGSCRVLRSFCEGTGAVL